MSGVNADRMMPGSPVLVRYADDLVAMCGSREQAEQVEQRLAAWLAPRGLRINEDKTQIVRLEDGFDFLGFNIRRYRNGKLLIRPSKAAVRRFRERLTAEMRALRGANAQAVIRRLNPVIRGWAAYTGRWCPRRPTSPGHPHVEARLSGRSEATRTNRGAGLSTGTSARPQSPGTTGGCSATATAAPTSPSSPGRRSFGTRWSKARRHPTTLPWPSTGPCGVAAAAPLDNARLRLIQAQHGRCPLCRGLLLHADREPQTPDEWEQWVRSPAPRSAARRSPPMRSRHVERSHRTPTHTRPLRAAAQQRSRARAWQFCLPVSLRACLSRMPGKRACPVLRGPGPQQCAPATRPRPGRSHACGTWKPRQGPRYLDAAVSRR